MLPRQFGKQLMFGRVAGFPFGNVDAIAFQFLDIFTAEMLRSIAVTKYGCPVSKRREPFRIGFDFGSTVAIEVGGGETPHRRVGLIEAELVTSTQQSDFRHPVAGDYAI